MVGGLARLSGALPYVQHVIPKAVAKVYPKGSSCISPTTAPSEGMPIGSLPYEKPTIIIHGVDTAYPELHDVAITHVMASPPMQVTVSVGKLAKAIIRVAREARVAPMAMGTHGRTGWRHLLRDRMAGAELHHVPCPIHTPMGSRQELFSPCGGNFVRNSSATTCQPCSVMVPLPGRW